MVELDKSEPIEGWKGRQLWKIRFKVDRVDSGLRSRDTRYGLQEYFFIWPDEEDTVISLPKWAWRPSVNAGDVVEALVYDNVDMSKTFINVAGDKKSREYGLKIIGKGTSAKDGEYLNVSIETGYISNLKYDSWAEHPDDREGAHYIANNIDSSLDGVKSARFTTASFSKSPTPDRWRKDELQFSILDCNGVKDGTLFKVKSINDAIQREFHHTATIKASDFRYVEGGAKYTLVENIDDVITEYLGFIDEEFFPFECSTMINKVVEMYPEEFNHPVVIDAMFVRFDRYKKERGMDKFVRTTNYRQKELISIVGLDIPSIADDMKNVTNIVMQEAKYAKAISALRALTGSVTYRRARSVFDDLDLEFSEDEYYEEIEARLIKEHREYDRHYFDILRQKIDEHPGAEWGGNPATGEFIAAFPTEKLIVLELPVPGRATYFYRIHDGMSIDEMLARISLASPQNGVKRSALWSKNSFKEELVDPYLVDNPNFAASRLAYLESLVKDKIITSINEGIRSWTGYIGRAIHRSYENFEEKLDSMINDAASAKLTSGGYEIIEKRRNPASLLIGAQIASHMAQGPIISGAVAATTGFFLGKHYEKKQIESELEASLMALSNVQRAKSRKWEEDGYEFMGIASVDELKAERVKIIKKGYKPHEIRSKDFILLYGEKREKTKQNPELVNPKTKEAYEVFHDQPHRNVVKADIFDNPEQCKILGPLKHLIYFCSKWSEDEGGEVTNEENIDIHYIHEWNEEGNDNDAGVNCMWVAATPNMKNIILLGDCEVLDVGITDAESSNDAPEKLLKDYKIPKEVVWLGECKELSYISNGQKNSIKTKGLELCTDNQRKKLFIVEES